MFGLWEIKIRGRTHLDETSVDEYASGERVEHARDDARSRAAWVVRRAHAEANRDSWEGQATKFSIGNVMNVKS